MVRATVSHDREGSQNARTSNDQNRGHGAAVVKSDASRDRVFWERSVCPTSWISFSLPPTQDLVGAPLFFHFFNGTTPTSWGDPANDFLLPQRLEDAHIVGDGGAAHVE